AGLVASLSRPGGNVTGVSFIGRGLGLKRLELLHEIVPKARTVGVFVNPDNPTSISERGEVEAAAPPIGLQTLAIAVGQAADFEAAFAKLAQENAESLLVTSDAAFLDARKQLTDLAAHHAIPAIYFERVFVAAGGLISYSTNLADAYRQAGGYVARI